MPYKDKSKRNEKIPVKCIDCGKEIFIRKDTYQANVKKDPVNPPCRCRECFNKYLKNIKKQRWAELTPEEQTAEMKKINAGRKEWWDNLSPEGKKEYSEKLSESANNMSDSKKAALSKIRSKSTKKRWKNASDEYKHEFFNNLNQSRNDWWNSLTDQEKHDFMMRPGAGSAKRWESMSEEEREQVSRHMHDVWVNKSEEEKKLIIEKTTKASRDFWDNVSDEFMDGWSKRLSEIRSNYLASLTTEEKNVIITKLCEGHKQYFDSLSEEEMDQYQKLRSESLRRYWIMLPPEKKAELTHSRISSSNKDRNNELTRRFEKLFNESTISEKLHWIKEFPTIHNSFVHNWDYGIMDRDNNLVAVVDIDGKFYHADNCDYDGLWSKEEYDESRSLAVPDDILLFIIHESSFRNDFEYMVKHVFTGYTDYIDSIVHEMRLQPFPEPSYSQSDLMQSYNNLCRMKCNDKYHRSISLNTRIGDRLIQHFHTSIWMDHRKGELSPYEAWQDVTLLRKCIENRIIYQTHLNPNKILQGFNVSKIAPKVSVFSAGRAKMIIHRYLEEFDTIFDPFSGYSGRMLGTISLGKRYIGQDLSLNHVNESNKLMDFLRSKGIQFQAEITQRDILQSTGEYPCLFTCPPYSDKEQWVGVPVDTRSCDDWIDECLRRFKCKRYVFVVDSTEKYADKVVDVIENRSHLSNNAEYVVSLEGDFPGVH